MPLESISVYNYSLDLQSFNSIFKNLICVLVGSETSYPMGFSMEFLLPHKTYSTLVSPVVKTTVFYYHFSRIKIK